MSHPYSFTRLDSPPKILSSLMDSQDSSVAPPPAHQQQQQQLQHHPQNVFLGPPQSHHLQQQQSPSPNSYVPFHSSVSANNSMSHQQNQQQQQQQQQQSRYPFSSMVNSAPPPQQQQQMPVDYSDGGNVTSPPTGGVVGSGSGIEVVKKKRGRPRKYSPPDGSGTSIAPGLQVNQTAVAVTESGGGAGAGETFSSEPPVKKHRGRPPGSGKKQLEALGIPGAGFTPHLITVNAGEDIATKIMTFTQEGPRTVCIVTANGAVCSVTLRQPASSVNTVTHEGLFEIISLSGSFLLADNNGSRNRVGGLSVALARADGSVLGGGVAGMLKAATPIQIIVVSFVLDEKKPKSMPAIVPAPTLFGTIAATVASPPSQGGGGGAGGASSNSSDDNLGSPLDQGGYAANAGQPMQNAPMFSNMGWGNNTMNMHQN